MPRKQRRICFVTGTRAEFGLMERTLRAIQREKTLQLQLIVTGMHLDRSRGQSINEIRKAGFEVDSIVPWRGSRAVATGRATVGIAEALERLQSDVVLVVGDRVEAFAGAAAGHLSDRVVAHVHGGDRALGQVDDALRHSITKLAHIHFAATDDSARRLIRLGEDNWRVHTVGAPGIDGIVGDADPKPFAGMVSKQFILLVLHPTDGNDDKEHQRAKIVFHSIQRAVPLPVVIIYGNNDPGSAGIAKCWRKLPKAGVFPFRNLPRSQFLSAMRDCAALVGNSSAGIIEAASFAVSVVDIGNRQAGRLRGNNVIHANFEEKSIVASIKKAMNGKRMEKYAAGNIYGGADTAAKIVDVLNTMPIDTRLSRKLIAY